MSYNEKTTEMMKTRYLENPTRETVNEIAEELGKSVKSVIGKLSREGIYRREVYTSKTGEQPITKLEIVAEIAAGLGIDQDDLVGLDKAPKPVLKRIKDAVLGTEEE